MTLSKEVIGKRIANARRTMCMTQVELSEKIDISEKYLSRIECGRQLPSILIAAKICEVLCISVDELLRQAKSYNNQAIQNEMSGLSSYEQNRIAEIIKIIREIKNHT